MGWQKHATSDVGLIFTAYNLRRLFNIIDPKLLKTYLEGLAALFFVFWRPSESKLSVFQATKFSASKPAWHTALSYLALKPLKTHGMEGDLDYFWVFRRTDAVAHLKKQ
jgi:hypothetical protein